MNLSRYYPDDWLPSAYEIDYEDLFARGFRGIMYDIDNTLVNHGAPADDRSIELFRRLRGIGFATCLLSNNRKKRVEPFARAVGSPFICLANKPFVRNYLRACEIMGTSEKTSVLVGDQLFTDVWGSRRAGIYSILVQPLNPKEEIQIVLKRKLERIVLNSYKKEMKKLGRTDFPEGTFQSGREINVEK
ncbi:MAG: YqeG family HAD IIIA-type phosphatase [Bilifractor sp.]|jgi:HAD superfamily phosphatase (TIGR01668 family)